MKKNPLLNLHFPLYFLLKSYSNFFLSYLVERNFTFEKKEVLCNKIAPSKIDL